MTYTGTTPHSKKSSQRDTRTPANEHKGIPIAMRLVARRLNRSAVEAPLANPAGVHVDEIGMRIIAHSAASERQRGLPQFQSVHAGHSQIDGLGLDVQAVLGHAGGMGAQSGIAFW